MFRKYFSSIAGASILIALTTIISRGLGVFREIIFANNFGFDKTFDLYLAASIIPFTLQNIIYYIAQNYYIPLFSSVKNEKDLNSLFIKEFLVFFLYASTILAILFLSSPIIMKYYFHNVKAEEFILVNDVFKLSLLIIPLSSISSYLIAYQYFKHLYTKAAFSQMLLNLIIIISIVLTSNLFGIFSIPISFIAGNILQLVYLLFVSKKYFIFTHFKKIKYKEYRPSQNFILIIVIEVFGSIYILIDRYFINYVKVGEISALNYANSIYILPIIFFSFSLATVLFPKFDNDIKSNTTLLTKSIKVNFFFFIPTTILFYFYGDVIIKILFMRGKFLENEVAATFHFLKILSVSMLFYSIYSILNKLLYMINKQKILFYVSVSALFVKILLNIVLVNSYGGTGLAISSAIIYFFLFLLTYLYITVHIPELNKNIIKPFIKYLLLSVIALFITSALSSFININSLISIFIFLFIYISILVIIKDENIKYRLKY